MKILTITRKLKNKVFVWQKVTVYKKHFTALISMCTDSGNTWRGVPISEIYGSHSPWGAPEFRLVAPSYNHAVLYHVPSSGCVAADKPPKPQIGQDKWDQDHVRMPYSCQSLYPVDDGNHLKKRWEMIESALSKPIRNSQELADAIISYNTKFRNIWKFKGLHKLFNEYLEEEESQYFFDVTLPEIAKLALALPKLVQAPIPLLRQHKNRSISLSQQQIASLLANAFFCTFPRRNSNKRNSEYASYPYINFNTYKLYEATDSDSNMEKLKSICHYFRRVVTKVPVGTLTFVRRSVPPRDCPDWAHSQHVLATVPLHVDSERTIEDSDGLIQVDFANKFLGGGVLGHGCVQEEIRFVICPELMISMLFTEVLRPNEALIIIGCERYSKYTGYGHTYQWAGEHRDCTPRDSSGRRRCAVLAIDALPYTGAGRECTKDALTRELNKAWVGVSFDIDPQSSGLQFPGIATGNWGCGAFGGTPHLKSLLQLMACAQARRPIAYYTFGDSQLRDDIVNIYNLLARYNVTVGQLYKMLIKFSETKSLSLSRLHQYIEQSLRGEGTPVAPTVLKLNCTKEEDMDTSIPEVGPVTALEKALNNSPDLFSQDEMEKNIVQLNGQTDTKENKQSHEPISIHSSSSLSLFDTIIQMEENEAKINNLMDSQSTLFTKQSSLPTNQSTLLAKESSLPANQSSLPTNHSSLPANEHSLPANENSLTPNQSLLPANQSSLPANQNTLVSKSSKRMSLTDPNQSIDEEKLDAAAELKKKISRKITDYFSKKSI